MTLQPNTLTPEQLQKLQAALQQLQEALQELPVIPPEERRRLTKSGHRSAGFVRYLANLVRNEPDHCPVSFDRDAFLQEADLWEPLMIQQAILHQQVDRIDSQSLLLGNNAMHRAQELFQVLRASSRSHPELAEHVRVLSTLYRRRNSSSANASTPSVS